LAYLTHFFESNQLTYLTADILLNSSIPIHLPKLKIDGKEYDAKLGIEEQYTFDMEMVINATQQAQTVFGNLAHYLYSVLASSHFRNESFDAMNALDWLLVAAIVCGFLALIWAAILHYKLQTVSLLLTASRLPAAYANDITLPLVFHYSRPTTPQQTVVKDFFHYQQEILKILPVDLTLLIILLLSILGLIIYLIYRRYMSMRQRTQLWLEIGNTKDFRFWHVANLRFNPGHYRIDVDKQSTAIRINEFFFLATVEYGRGITITNTLLNQTVKTRRCDNISLAEEYGQGNL